MGAGAGSLAGWLAAVVAGLGWLALLTGAGWLVGAAAGGVRGFKGPGQQPCGTTGNWQGRDRRPGALGVSMGVLGRHRFRGRGRLEAAVGGGVQAGGLGCAAK